MTNKEKQLLLKDLCTRLPYGVKAKSKTSHLEINTIDGYFVDGDGRKMFHFSEPDFWQTVDNFQYYLRPMSSMTDEEEKSLRKDTGLDIFKCTVNKELEDLWVTDCSVKDLFCLWSWLNKHHFDYNGLIEKGLALEASEDIYD